MNTTIDRPTALLESVHRAFEEGRSGEALRDLFEGLRELREAAGEQGWRAIRDEVRCHDLRARLHEDPMTRRSFEKPRGYAGDAVLLDYIYRLCEPSEASSLGRDVYEYATGRPAARAVRHRRELLAHAIDRAAERGEGGGRVLSVACGHLREADLAASLQRGWIERFVALDADPESLAEVAALGLECVEPLEMSVGRLFGRAERLGRFELTYSAGLYDYLDADLARRLTACLFSTLAPGGRLIVSNFLPTVADVGYMETFMGWELIYRTEAELARVADDIPSSELARVEVRRDPFDAIAYLELERGAGLA